MTFEEQIDHYKADSYFTLAPSELQRAGGGRNTGVAGQLGLYVHSGDALPHRILQHEHGSMGSAYTSSTSYTILSPQRRRPADHQCGLRCDHQLSALAADADIYPTEMLRLAELEHQEHRDERRLPLHDRQQHLPNYYENFQGLDGTIRSATFTGSTSAQRRMVNFDYGIIWLATKTISLSDQISFSNLHQPGNANITPGITQNTPTRARRAMRPSTTRGRWSRGPTTRSPATQRHGRSTPTSARSS